MILYAFLKPPRRANQHKKMLACMHIKSKLNYLFQMPYLSDCGALFNTIKFIPINMINRLLSERHRLLPFLIRHFSRSKEAQLKLSAGAQRALWANKIITQIADAKYQLAYDIIKPSLRQLIIQCKNPIMGVAFEDTPRKEVIKMFESGINLNRQVVFTQGRITGGLNIDDSFTFCPNFLATKQIFQYLRRPTKYTLFHDSYGISKTVSIIMYIELSRHIHKYIYDAVVNKTQQEEEYKMLRQRKCIHQMTKYWYWSIDPSDELKPGYLQEKIAAQATQLSQEQRLAIKNCKTPQEAINLVKDFYRKTNISHIPVVDQINKLASLMRKWNAYEEKHRQNIEGHEDFKTAIIHYNNALELDKYLKQFISISSTFSWILNSSINLEANLLYGKKQASLKYDSLSLKLLDKDNKHELSSFSSLKFGYLTNLQKDWGKNDFWHSCWFEFSRNITKNISNSALEDLRKNFLDYVKGIEIKQYYRFLEINLFLYKKKDEINAIAEVTDAEQQIKQIKTLMDAFNQHCFQKCVQRAEKFINSKGDQELKKDYLRAMYVIALKEKLRGQKELIVSLKMLKKHIMSKKTPVQYFQSNEHDKELIPFQSVDQEKKKIRILWGSSLFCEIMQHVLYRQFYYQQALIDRSVKQAINKKSHLGNLIESLIVLQLLEGVTLLLRNVDQQRKHEKVNGQIRYVRSKADIDEKSFNISRYKVQSAVGFDAFPLKQEKYDSFDFEKSLGKIIAQCDKKPGQWVAGIPTCTSTSSTKSNQTQSQNNPSVDFILAKRDDTNNVKKYILNSVDVTISRGSVSSKEAKARKLYEKLLTTSNQNKFQVTHIILCPRKSCIGYLKEGNLTVSYSNIEMMDFEDTQCPNELIQFKGLQRHFMLETIELEVEKEK